jgi:hypothetical protein
MMLLSVAVSKERTSHSELHKGSTLMQLAVGYGIRELIEQAAKRAED